MYESFTGIPLLKERLNDGIDELFFNKVLENSIGYMGKG